MREIKFRAWLKDYEEMIFWDLFDINQDESGRYYIGGFKVINKDDLIVMQFTGLHDKNGKEIFEGDIDIDGFIVTYVGDVKAGLGMNAGWYLQRSNFESWVELECNNDLEVIGNIYENPEKEKL